MSSFSTAGGGVKAVTQIQPGKRGLNIYNASEVQINAAVIPVGYLASAFATVLNVTGSGYLAFSSFQSLVASTTARVIITIDGVVVIDDSATNIAVNFMMQVGTFRYGSDGISFSKEAVPFNKSLLVVVKCDSGSTYHYDYYLN